jgi:RNA polymerase-binding transcription factor DksA
MKPILYGQHQLLWNKDTYVYFDNDAMGHAPKNALRLKELLLGKIIQSLGKIEEGTFGICEACGEEISIERLRARPVATYCITCKNKMEALENQ